LNRDRRRQVEEIFDVLMDGPPGSWDAAMAELCGDDDALRGEVSRLLDAHRRAEGILDRSMDMEGLLEDHSSGPSPEDVVGKYRVLREIGRGGMGRVYLAERADGHFRQRVALKLISEVNPEMERRIVAERQILASLQHPNIGRLLDGGVTGDGRPFLVMEYVNGLPIDLFCDRMRLSIRERMRLFLTVLGAVEHAHNNLVVHRDLKPSNIIVTPSGEVKLLDFGIAKLLNPELVGGDVTLTRAQDRALTPEYASPEQVRGEAITTASDVYSLGVVLYQILSGHKPYRITDGHLPDLVRAVCEEDPPSPSDRLSRKGGGGPPEEGPDPESLGEIARARHTTSARLCRQLRGDLDAIVMKALRKEPNRRYGSVGALTRDVERYLDGRPVEARKGTGWYRTRKLAARHRGGVTAAGLIVASLVGGAAVASWQAGLASRERDRARDALRESEEVTGFLLDLFRASDPWEDPGGEVTALDLLGRGVTRARELRGEPLVQARMLEVMARAHENLGRYGDAAELDGRAVQLLQEEKGEDSGEVAAAMVEWGLALSRNGQYDSARVVLARARGVQEEALGPLSLELTRTLEAQARVDIYLGHLEEAEARARESLEIREQVLGADATETVHALGVVASILRYQGRYEAAEATFREVLDRRRQVSSDPAQLSSDMLQIAGMIIEHGGDLDEAEGLAREALSLQEPDPGVVAVNRVWALTTLGQLMEERGDLPAAEYFFREGVSTRLRTFGDLHPLVAESQGTLGMFLASVGRLKEAEIYLRRAADVNLRTVGRNHTRYAGSLSGLASLLLKEGRLEEADSLAEEALTIRRRAQGLSAAPVAEALVLLAETRAARGLREDAETLLLRAMEIAADQPPSALLPRRIHGQLADLYESMGRAGDATRHRALSRLGS